MPTVSAAQERLMQAAAHTKGGYGGVPQAVGKEFVGQDSTSRAELVESVRNAKQALENHGPDAKRRAAVSAAEDRLKEYDKRPQAFNSRYKGDSVAVIGKEPPGYFMDKLDSVAARLDGLTKRLDARERKDAVRAVKDGRKDAGLSEEEAKRVKEETKEKLGNFAKTIKKPTQRD